MVNMDVSIIAARIKEIRLEHHLNQSQFGKNLPSRRTPSPLWENGKSVPTTEYVILIATTFGVSADYLLGLTEY